MCPNKWVNPSGTHKFMNSKKITLWKWIIDLKYVAEVVNNLRSVFKSVLGLALQPLEKQH